MLFGKKQRALEGERDKYKAEVERLRHQNHILHIQLEDLTESPAGCRIGNWCKGCKYADVVPFQLTDHGLDKRAVRACLYGACEHREAVEPYGFGGCV